VATDFSAHLPLALQSPKELVISPGQKQQNKLITVPNLNLTTKWYVYDATENILLKMYYLM
jgi:hypothetical protein